MTKMALSSIACIHEYCINTETRELFLHIDQGSSEEMLDWRAANRFIKNLSILESINHKPIVVHQCTCGGDWNYGMAIYDAIRTAQSPIALLAHAHARSMSSIIPQAADFRAIMPSADFMIHFGTETTDGDTKSVIANVEWSKVQIEQMLNVYADRLALAPFFKTKRWSAKKIKEEFLNPELNTRRECYWTAQKAVVYGFMDAVYGTLRCKTLSDLRRAALRACS